LEEARGNNNNNNNNNNNKGIVTDRPIIWNDLTPRIIHEMQTKV